MPEQEFFAAVGFAFLGWMAAVALALIRARSLKTHSSKSLCWTIPFLGLLLWAYLIYQGLYGESSGFRLLLMGLVSVAFCVLAVLLPLAQLLFGYFARMIDLSDE